MLTLSRASRPGQVDVALMGMRSGLIRRNPSPGLLYRALEADHVRDAKERGAASAITRAAEEPPDISNVAFGSVDMSAPGAGRELAAEFGQTDVFVRGVFHVLDRSEHHAMADNLRDLLGARRALLLAETNFPGSSLSYVEYLGDPPRAPRRDPHPK